MRKSPVLFLSTTLASLYLAHEVLEFTHTGKPFCLWNQFQSAPSINEEVFAELETVVPKYLGKKFLESPEWEALKNEGQFEKYGNDETCRTPTVGTQTASEETYALMLNDDRIDLKKADEFLLVIHTPLPTTPLTKGQVDLSIQKDPERMRATIIPRPNILINILEAGGKIIVFYPEGGLEKRTEEGQAFYKSLLKKYPGRLIDMPISKESMPNFPADQIGASAVIVRNGKIENFFSIGAYQAIKAIQKEVPWSITLGDPEKPKVKKMIKHREELFNVKEMIEHRKKFMLQEANREDFIDFTNGVNHSI